MILVLFKEDYIYTSLSQKKENTVFFEQSEVRGPDLLSRQSYKYENELIYETESEI